MLNYSAFDGRGKGLGLMELVSDGDECFWLSRRCFCLRSFPFPPLRPNFSFHVAASRVQQKLQKTVEWSVVERMEPRLPFFLSSPLPAYFPTFLWMNFATGRTMCVGVIALRASMYMKKKNWAHFLMFLYSMWLYALLSAKSVKRLFTKRKNAFFSPSLVDSKPAWNASRSSSSAAFKKDLSIPSA